MQMRLSLFWIEEHPLNRDQLGEHATKKSRSHTKDWIVFALGVVILNTSMLFHLVTFKGHLEALFI